MKKLLMWIGGISLVLLAVAVAFVVYIAVRGNNLDASSKAYAERAIPVVVAHWSEQDLYTRSAPGLQKVLDANATQTKALFAELSRLGALKRLEDCKGHSFLWYSTKYGKVVSAKYVCGAAFDKGPAKITAALLRVKGRWLFSGFHMDSPVFLR